MLAGIGWITGRSWLERLAWAARRLRRLGCLLLRVAVDLRGWPHSPGTWDVLFLIPVPWIGPIWAPVAVSGALIGFGLEAARRAEGGIALRAGWREVGLGLAGGLLVVLSFTADAPRIMAGGLPGWFPWPLFVAGMASAAWGAVLVLRPRGGGDPGGLRAARWLEGRSLLPTPFLEAVPGRPTVGAGAGRDAWSRAFARTSTNC